MPGDSAESQELKVYLSLGGNMGDTEAILVSAIREINKNFPVTGLSGLYRTTPMHVTKQREFLNCALVCIKPAGMALIDMLGSLQQIEALHGRDRSRSIEKGPRFLDIDIILAEGIVADWSGLSVPHKEYMNRRFVLVPLLDIDPNLTDPRNGLKLRTREAELQSDVSQGIYHHPSEVYNELNFH